MHAAIAQTLGVDISKETLDVHLHPCGVAARFGNDKAGFAALKKWLRPHQPKQIVYEATGAYHRAFETWFLEAGFCMAKVNPRQARRFAEAIGTRAKTDAVDAAMLAKFGAMVELRPLDTDTKLLADMQELLVARRALIKDQTAARNRKAQRTITLIKTQAAQRLAQIERDIAAIDAMLRAHIKASPALKARYDILVSIPGLGEITAITLVIDMPELGGLDNSCAASLAGLAPIARDSGKFRGQRSVGGGRTHVRQALYMPALVAAFHNPDFKRVYKRLIEAGRPAKVAITAVMRKMIVLANALLKKNAKWTPIAA